MRTMLPRAHRLTGKRDVERVSRHGRPVFVSSLTVRVAPNQESHVRMTAVAGLKVSKRAVQRNRVKRLLREVFQKEFLPSITQPVDLVIHAKAALVGATFDEVRTALGQALIKAGVIHRP